MLIEKSRNAPSWGRPLLTIPHCGSQQIDKSFCFFLFFYGGGGVQACNVVSH